MKISTYCFFACFAICVSCSERKQNPRANMLTGNPSEMEEKTSQEDTIIEKLSVFSKCTDYNNTLSTVASKSEFVQIDNKLPINDFMTFDVAISDEYIFLMGLEQIVQYDRNGKYIQKIGRHGKGPEEFFRLSPPLQLDQKNKLIYAFDTTYGKIVVYDFDGKFVKKIPVGLNSGCFELIDPELIALRQISSDRYKPDCKVIRFIDHKGKEIKSFPSYLYPLPEKMFKGFGASESFLWKHNDKLFCLEYGADTIFQIKKDSLIPARIITGELRLDKNELFQKDRKSNKLDIIGYIMRPNAGIFESDSFIIFKLFSYDETFYTIYNKSDGHFYRTFYKNEVSNKSGCLKMDYFTDDLTSGLSFNPQYQSEGKSIAFVPALDIFNRKQEILDFIAKHPTKEGEKLKAIVDGNSEMSNAVLMIVSFK